MELESGKSAVSDGMDNSAGTVGNVSHCLGVQCHPPDLLNVVFTITVVISIVGTVGNIASMVVILSSPLRKVTNSVLVCQLNFINLLYCLLMLPIQAALFSVKKNFLGSTFCNYMAAFRYWLTGVSVFLVAAIAVYRALQVAHNNVFRVMAQPDKFILSSVVCYTVPTFYVCFPLSRTMGFYRFDETFLECVLDSDSSDNYITFQAVGYCIPITLMLGSYLYIVIYVRGHRKAVTYRFRVHAEMNLRRSTRRIYSVIGITVLTFLFGTTPYYVAKVIDPMNENPVIYLWCSLAVWSVYMLNPAVYSVLDTKFRAASFRLFKRNTLQSMSSQTACSQFPTDLR